jgi:hypothetical protein
MEATMPVEVIVRDMRYGGLTYERGDVFEPKSARDALLLKIARKVADAPWAVRPSGDEALASAADAEASHPQPIAPPGPPAAAEAPAAPVAVEAAVEPPPEPPAEAEAEAETEPMPDAPDSEPAPPAPEVEPVAVPPPEAPAIPEAPTPPSGRYSRRDLRAQD